MQKKRYTMMGCYQLFQKGTAKPIDTVENLCRMAETKTTDYLIFAVSWWSSVSSVRRAVALST